MPRRPSLRGRASHLLAAAAVLLALASGGAQAQIGSERYSSIVIDARSGRAVSAANPDELRHPASLTKMMTLYMVFEALRDRRIRLHQAVPVSATAAAMAPTKLGVPPGGRLTVEEAILALVTRSANDAAAALGELLGGDEGRFARIMTLRARALGMTRTIFRNASGLPDPGQVTTARDMATLGRRLVLDFPKEYKYFSTAQFRFRGRVLSGHNNLLDAYPGADGIKTGYIDASGFNLVASAVRGRTRVVGVVMGGARAGERDLHMIALLDQGFEALGVPVAPAPTVPRMQLVAAAQAAPAPSRAGRWAVQVGTFRTDQAARQAALAARRVVESGEVQVEALPGKRKTQFRARLVGLTAPQVQGACPALARRGIACSPVRPEAGQVAGR